MSISQLGNLSMKLGVTDTPEKRRASFKLTFGMYTL